MAYKEHLLLQFGGSLYGSEIWSCGIRVARPIETGLGDLPETYVDDYVNDIRAFINTTYFNDQTTLDFVKCNKIGPDGRYMSSTHTVERQLAGTTGALAQGRGTGGSYVPPQSSLAVTLHTAKQRGPGSRGRFYVPAPVAAASVLADGRLPDPASGGSLYANFVGHCVTFIRNLNNMPLVDPDNAPRVVVATPGGRNMPEGDNIVVTGVSVGRVVDTQRRRRNALEEAPVITAL